MASPPNNLHGHACGTLEVQCARMLQSPIFNQGSRHSSCFLIVMSIALYEVYMISVTDKKNLN